MASNKLFRKIRYYIQYVPFTLHTLLWAIAIIIAYKLLYKPLPKKADDPAPFLPFILLMAKLAFWFLVGLIAVSVISTFMTWAYYLWLKKKRGALLKLQFSTERDGTTRTKSYLHAQLDGVRRPVLGFVKGRLFYDNQELTDYFSLSSDKRKEKSIWRAAITGKNRLELPDIKEYELKGGFIYFQDMLHLFSLAASQPVSGQFYQPPVGKDEPDAPVFPKKTETMDVRIEQLRRVEGEHLNYKDFESGDDVRRIVWKVYAKNRDLVVRIPELYEPYASHLYFYASFFAEVKAQWLSEGYMKEMLNYYKNHVWAVLQTLSKKEWEMRYIPDQQFSIPEQASTAARDARIISNSTWHKNNTLSSYFDARKGAVLCVSSFTDPDDLRDILEKCDASTVIYLIKCSQVFKHFVAWSLFKRLLFLPPQDRLNQLRTRWLLSPMRFQIQKRERELEEILDKSHVIAGTL